MKSIVDVQVRVKIPLHLVQSLVELDPSSHLEVLLQQRAVEALDDTVALESPYRHPAMIDFL